MRIIMALLIVFLASPTMAAEMYVTTAQELQGALTTAASNGESDSIYLSAGIYTGGFSHLSLEDESLTIMPESGLTAEDVILDGNSEYRVLNLVSLDYPIPFTITNITIRNGADAAHGGLYVETPNGDIVITDCFFHSNDGGKTLAVYAEVSYPGSGVTGQGTLSFQRNVVSDNGLGGYRSFPSASVSLIFSVSPGTLLVEDNYISGNQVTGSSSGAGGIYARLVAGPATIQRNTIINNSGPSSGYGAIDARGYITFADNIVQGNYSQSRSATGMSLINGSTVTRNVISDNTSDGVWSAGLDLTLTGNSPISTIVSNNLIYNNINLNNYENYQRTGGVYVATSSSQQASIMLINNTITGNSSYNAAGVQADIDLESTLYMYNNIVWGNGDAGQGSVDILLEGLGTKVGHNNDYSTINGLWGDYSGNIDMDPSFVTVDDLHLQLGSDCLESGYNTAPDLPSTDIEGQPRIIGEYVDMGAYEHLYGSEPIARFSAAPVFGAVPLPVDFVSHSLGDISSWEWDFGDGETSDVQNPTHDYISAGTYTVSLTVTGADGSTTKTKDNLISVAMGPPQANAGPDRATANHQITLDGSQSSDYDGTIDDYQWSLVHRDNPTSNKTALGELPTVSELAAGFYDVTLFVTDNDGLTDTDEMILAVLEPWDVNGDEVLGLPEAIHILRSISGY